MLRRLFLFLPAFALLIAATALPAQTTGGPPKDSYGNWTNKKKQKERDANTRHLQGMVNLPDESPAEGAVVKLKNLKTLQVRSYITQKDGKYSFQNLSTNVDYEIRSDYKDLASDTRTLSVFDSRYEPIINLKLEPAKDKGKKDDKSE